MKSVTIVAVLLGLAVMAMPAHAQQPAAAVATGPVVRYIVPQRIVAEASDAKAEFGRFQASQQEKTAALRVKQQALEGLREQLGRATEPVERGRLAQQEVLARADLERATAQAQQDLQALQRQMQAGLQARIKAALDEILKGQNVQIVLNAESTIVWAVPGADLTSAVIDRLNTGRASTAPASPAN